MKIINRVNHKVILLQMSIGNRSKGVYVYAVKAVLSYQLVFNSLFLWSEENLSLPVLTACSLSSAMLHVKACAVL